MPLYKRVIYARYDIKRLKNNCLVSPYYAYHFRNTPQSQSRISTDIQLANHRSHRKLADEWVGSVAHRRLVRRDRRRVSRTRGLFTVYTVSTYGRLAVPFPRIASSPSPLESLTPTLCVQFFAAGISGRPRRRPASQTLASPANLHCTRKHSRRLA